MQLARLHCAGNNYTALVKPFFGVKIYTLRQDVHLISFCSGTKTVIRQYGNEIKYLNFTV